MTAVGGGRQLAEAAAGVGYRRVVGYAQLDLSWVLCEIPARWIHDPPGVIFPDGCTHLTLFKAGMTTKNLPLPTATVLHNTRNTQPGILHPTVQ
jgi:hypothetical protein